MGHLYTGLISTGRMLFDDRWLLPASSLSSPATIPRTIIVMLRNFIVCHDSGGPVAVSYTILFCHLFAPRNMLALFPLVLEPVLDADIG